jgi:hypothetical protein
MMRQVVCEPFFAGDWLPVIEVAEPLIAQSNSTSHRMAPAKIAG